MKLFFRLRAAVCALTILTLGATLTLGAALTLGAMLSQGALAAPSAPPAEQSAISADSPKDAVARTLASIQAVVKTAEKALGQSHLTDAQLSSLRDDVDPAAKQAQQLVADLEPRLAAVDARLKQIGPPPAPPAPAEPDSVTAARRQQTDLEAELKAVLSQAKVASIQTNQLLSRISALRSQVFVSNVFVQTRGLFSPGLWAQAISEAPRDVSVVFVVLGQWGRSLSQTVDGWTWAIAIIVLAGIVGLYAACSHVVRRIIARADAEEKKTRLAKAFTAIWVVCLIAAPPVSGIVALALAARAFDLVDAVVEPFLRTLIYAVMRIALTLAIARALLEPKRPNWRLVDLTSPTCERLQTLALAVAAIISFGEVLNSVADQVGFSLALSLAIRGTTALTVAVAMALALRGIVPEPDADACLGPVLEPQADWSAPLRFAAWAIIVTLIGAVAIGYVAFAAFLLEQLVWVSLLGSALFVSLIVVDEGLTALFQPEAAVGRALIRSLGLKRGSLEQLAILVSGLLALALHLVALFLALAPWGIASTDLLDGLRAAFFGFQVGGLTISLLSIVMALGVFAVCLLVTRWIQRWFDKRLLPATQLDVGLRNSIGTSIGYVGIFLAASAGLAQVGLDFQKVAIVAGALSVGIGFGLQSIVNNFVSGLIILWERSIRVGDLVVIGEEQGHVKRINVRATEIETFDRATMIVPNSNLVGGVVKNWVRTDRTSRIKIPLTFAFPADPAQIRDVMISCAKNNSAVLSEPPPQAMLTSIDGAFKFELSCFVEDVERSARVKSELNFELFKRLKEAGLELPPASPAQVTVHVSGAAGQLAPSPVEAAQKGEGRQ